MTEKSRHFRIHPNSWRHIPNDHNLKTHHREKLKSDLLHLFIQAYQIARSTYSALQIHTSQAGALNNDKLVIPTDTNFISVCAHGVGLSLSQYHLVPSKRHDCLRISEQKADPSCKTVYIGSGYPVCLNRSSYCRPSYSSWGPCLSSLGAERSGKPLFPKLHLGWYQPSFE